MNTIRGVAAVTLASPPARRALLGVLLACSGAIYALRRSGNLWLLALLCALFLEPRRALGEHSESTSKALKEL